MSYILGIGLLYKKYKKNATIRIYIDNNLIETYQLTQNVDPIKVPLTIIERIKKTYLSKNIYMPETFHEIKDTKRFNNM